MTNPRLASRYAQSLLDIAQEQNVLNDVLADMKLIQAAISDSRELQLFLSSPIIKGDKKMNALNQLFEGKVQSLTLKFIQLLITKGREANLFDISASFEKLFDEKNKVKSIKVTTAVPMTDDVKKTVIAKAQQFVQGYDLKVEEIIDPELIGGFIIEVDDKLYDASVKTELYKIKKQFLSNAYIPQI